MKKKITFLASGNGGTLKFLYEAIYLLNLNIEINNIIADRACGAYNFGKEKKINSIIIPYSQKNPNNLIKHLKCIDTDIIITNIHKILDLNTLKTHPNKFINLHYSLLPAYSGLIGMQTVDEAKKNNTLFIGGTCHEVTEKVDAGKILAQGCIKVNWRRHITDIYNDVFRVSCLSLLIAIINKLELSPSLKSKSTLLLNPNANFDISLFTDKFWQKIQ